MNSIYTFPSPFLEATILSRTSQFIINVNINGDAVRCHCPTTGKIGNIDLAGRPCLLSKSDNPARKTMYTVEAISLDREETKEKTWIGINQIAINRYVSYFLENNSFSKMIDSTGTILREQCLGNSKLDFFVNNTYMEVKTPLQTLQIDIPEYVKTKKMSPLKSTDRFTKHIAELGKSLKEKQRAILLLCFMYDSPEFKVREKSANYEKVKHTVNKSMEQGVEIWQANFKLNKDSINIIDHFRVSL